jgi:hypothetical protein
MPERKNRRAPRGHGGFAKFDAEIAQATSVELGVYWKLAQKAARFASSSALRPAVSSLPL